jgi:hypothetical protein
MPQLIQNLASPQAPVDSIPAAVSSEKLAVPQTQETPTNNSELVPVDVTTALGDCFENPFRQISLIDGGGPRTNYLIKFSCKSQYAERARAALPAITEGQFYLVTKEGEYLTPKWAFLVDVFQCWSRIDWQTGAILAASLTAPESKPSPCKEDIRCLVIVATDVGLVPAILSARAGTTAWVKGMIKAQGDKNWATIVGTFRVTMHNSKDGFGYTVNHADPKPINAEQFATLKTWADDSSWLDEFVSVRQVFQDTVEELTRKAA